MSRMLTPELGIPESEPTDFEFVLGRRQVASVSLVALTALAIVTTAAYMAGKSTVPAVEVEKPQAVATVAPPPAVRAETARLPEPPLFASPEKGLRYLQLGSVERGFAILMVHGARKVGYPAFVAGGTNPNVYRVLVGPFDDKAQFETAQAMFVSMGLETFVRKYTESAETPEP